MPKGRVVLNDAGMRHLLQRGVRADIERRTEAAKDTAGGEAVGYHAHVDVRGMRVVGRVVAASPRARRAEAKDGRLSRAVDAARGRSGT